MPVVVKVSQATWAVGSWARISSSTASEIWSQTLSGWPSVTDSDVKMRLLIKAVPPAVKILEPVFHLKECRLAENPPSKPVRRNEKQILRACLKNRKRRLIHQTAASTASRKLETPNTSPRFCLVATALWQKIQHLHYFQTGASQANAFGPRRKKKKHDSASNRVKKLPLISRSKPSDLAPCPRAGCHGITGPIPPPFLIRCLLVVFIIVEICRLSRAAANFLQV